MRVSEAIPIRPTPKGSHRGQRDFDFEIGKWRAHVRKLAHPLSGSKVWEEFDGTVVTTPFMEGRGNLSEMNVDGWIYDGTRSPDG